MSDKTHHGRFEQDGIWVTAEYDNWRWYVSFKRGDTIVREETLPLDHEPRWGVDIGDVSALDDLVDCVLAELSQSPTEPPSEGR